MTTPAMFFLPHMPSVFEAVRKHRIEEEEALPSMFFNWGYTPLTPRTLKSFLILLVVVAIVAVVVTLLSPMPEADASPHEATADMPTASETIETEASLGMAGRFEITKMDCVALGVVMARTKNDEVNVKSMVLWVMTDLGMTYRELSEFFTICYTWNSDLLWHGE